jgi:FAD/FMN-containing dehydrogenase
MSSTVTWGALEAAIAGEVILPEAPEFDLAYRALNARYDDVRPQAVVRCGSAEDVAEAIRFARRHGMAVATRGGGHCFGARSSTGGLLADVTPMHSVEISDGEVTVGGGTRLGEVYDALLEQDLTIPAGSCPSVGVAGLALGGGLGIIGRKYGLTSDHLLRVEVVLADGGVLGCDDHHEEDLFWALRGGGPGNFGVVTALTFRTIRAPEATNFQLTWPFSDAAAVIDAWQSWAPVAPEELAASLVIGASAQVDEPPSVDVFGVMLGTGSDTAELVDQLVDRTRSDPASAFHQHMSFRETTRYWAERAARDRAEGVPPGQELRGCRFIKSEFFNRPLPAEVIEEVLENFLRDRVGGQSRELDFSPWGGGYNRMSADATAFVHREDLYWLKHATEVEPRAPRAEREAAHDWVTRSWRAVHPWGTGRVFPNFPDPDLEDWAQAYYGRNRNRLLDVKARYDPGNVFRFYQSLPVRRAPESAIHDR